jgi:hypothetical protein
MADHLERLSFRDPQLLDPMVAAGIVESLTDIQTELLEAL